MVDFAINSSLRTISGCFKPTPVFQLPVLAGMIPAGLMRKAATLALAWKAVKHDWHIMYNIYNQEWSVSVLPQVPPTIQQGGSGDAECHPWGPVEGCMDCGREEAGVGLTRTHPSKSPRIGPRRRRQGRRYVYKTPDDSKQTTNWGRPVQINHEEVETGGQCSMWVWRAKNRQQIPSSTIAHFT